MRDMSQNCWRGAINTYCCKYILLHIHACIIHGISYPQRGSIMADVMQYFYNNDHVCWNPNGCMLPVYVQSSC